MRTLLGPMLLMAATAGCGDDVIVPDLGEEGGDAEEIWHPWDPPTCEESEHRGSVATSVAAIPFSSADLSFWTNDEGCLTEIGIDLNSGDCSLSFDARQPDDQGGFPITFVSLNASGFCPDYPTELPTGRYGETATRKALGTIELQRPDVSWSQCARGQLIVRADLVLEGVGTVDIEMRGVELTLEGEFTGTHLDPSGECSKRR